MVFFSGAEYSWENAYKSDIVVFDKTGTLTYGTPEVTDVLPINGTAEDMFILAASVERLSEHPIAGAITRSAAYRYPQALPPMVEDFHSVIGPGRKWFCSGGTMSNAETGKCFSRPASICLLCILYQMCGKPQRTEVCIASDGRSFGRYGCCRPA